MCRMNNSNNTTYTNNSNAKYFSRKVHEMNAQQLPTSVYLQLEDPNLFHRIRSSKMHESLKGSENQNSFWYRNCYIT
jgi:hypothetical protein